MVTYLYSNYNSLCGKLCTWIPLTICIHLLNMFGVFLSTSVHEGSHMALYAFMFSPQIQGYKGPSDSNCCSLSSPPRIQMTSWGMEEQVIGSMYTEQFEEL